MTPGTTVRYDKPLWKVNPKNVNRKGIVTAVSKRDVVYVLFEGNKTPRQMYKTTLTIISEPNQVIRTPEYGC